MIRPPLFHKVHHLLQRDGKSYGHFQTDMVIVSGTPTLILEWMTTEDGEIPAVTVELDPKYLHPFPGEGFDYMYEHPVEDPRKFH